MITTKDWIKRAKKSHGNKYDYSKSIYTKAINNIIIGCPIHGWLEIEARRHIKGVTGCYKCGRELHDHLVTTHNKSRTKQYRCWKSMINRCHSIKHILYQKYGGRGIVVCDKWKNSYQEFYNDMGEKPEGMTLDRIDNDKGYSKENCRWANRTVQQNNRGKFNHRIDYEGISLTSAEWARILEVNRHLPAMWNKLGKVNKMFIKYNINNMLQKYKYV